LSKLNKEQIWVVITETWCGDSAQLLPGIAHIADSSEGKIILKPVFS
jgi:thioredoxin-like negative regulator of GroEL